MRNEKGNRKKEIMKLKRRKGSKERKKERKKQRKKERKKERKKQRKKEIRKEEWREGGKEGGKIKCLLLFYSPSAPAGHIPCTGQPELKNFQIRCFYEKRKR